MSRVHMLEVALEYAQRYQFLVFPLAGKVPFEGTNGYLDGSNNETVIRDNWEKYPNANIGITTGQKSGFYVVDIDPRNGGDDSLKELEAQYGSLPVTASVKTGSGGQHYYFKVPSDCQVKSRSGIYPGIDIKSDGGYIVAPPSIHPKTRKPYEWDDPLDEFPIELPPKWLTKLIVSRYSINKPSLEISKAILEGTRNATLCSFAGTFRNEGFSFNEIREFLLFTNKQRCKPPLEEKEVVKIATSVSKYPAPRQFDSKSGLKVIPLSQIKVEKVDWLWRPIIALNKVTLFQGDPGLGKSFLTLDIASRVSNGEDWPDSTNDREPGHVFLLSAEDDPSDTIKPRIDAAGGDANLIHIIQTNGFSIGEDLERLIPNIIKTKPRLLIIDPISAYLGKTDSHKNSEVRGIMARLVELASTFHLAVLAVTHLNKSSGSKGLYRTMGSLAFLAAVRSVWSICEDPEDSSSRLLLQTKSNISRMTDGFRFRFSDEEMPKLLWDKEPVKLRFEDVISGEQTGEKVRAIDVAKDFLLDFLISGPQQSTKIFAAGEKHGICEATLRRASKAIRVIAEKESFKGGWNWRLPQDYQNTSKMIN